MARKNKNIPAQKAKNSKVALKNLVKFCKKHIILIIISAILATIASILAVIGPNKLKDLTNEIQAGLGSSINIDAVLNIMIVLIAIYLTSSTFMAIQNILMTKVSNNVSKEMRTKIDKKINLVPIKYIDKTPHGDLLSRMTNDVDTISQGLNNSVGTLLHSIMLLLAGVQYLHQNPYILPLKLFLHHLNLHHLCLFYMP